MNPELEELVKILSHQHARRFGYEFDDVYQEARIVALEAVRTHDPKLGCLGKRVRYLVTRRIDGGPRSKFWRMRSCVKNARKVSPEASDALCARMPDRGQDPCFLADLLDELSEDAQAIVSIVLDSPGHVFEGADDKQCLSGLLQKWGWQESTINSAFIEIQEALA